MPHPGALRVRRWLPPAALLQDIHLLDLLELSGTTLEASRLLKLSQPTVSRRYRALAADFALVQQRRTPSGCVYGTTPVLRLLRLGSRAHRLSAGVARLGSDLLLQPLLADCPWLLPSPPRFRRVESWCELVRQGVLDGAVVSGLELSDTADLECSGLDLLPLGEIPLTLACTSEALGRGRESIRWCWCPTGRGRRLEPGTAGSGPDPANRRQQLPGPRPVAAASGAGRAGHGPARSGGGPLVEAAAAPGSVRSPGDAGVAGAAAGVAGGGGVGPHRGWAGRPELSASGGRLMNCCTRRMDTAWRATPAVPGLPTGPGPAQTGWRPPFCPLLHDQAWMWWACRPSCGRRVCGQG